MHASCDATVSVETGASFRVMRLAAGRLRAALVKRLFPIFLVEALAIAGLRVDFRFDGLAVAGLRGDFRVGVLAVAGVMSILV